MWRDSSVFSLFWALGKWLVVFVVNGYRKIFSERQFMSHPTSQPSGEQIFTCCLYQRWPRLCAVYALSITLSTEAQSTVYSTEDSNRQKMHHPVCERGRKE